MSCTVIQAQGLPNGGAVGPSTASPLVSQSGHKRSHDGNGTASAKGKRQKRKDVSKRAVFNSGGKSKIAAKPFRPDGATDWLKDKKLCLHCCQLGHMSFNCESKKDGQPAAPRPAACAKSAKA